MTLPKQLLCNLMSDYYLNGNTENEHEWTALEQTIGPEAFQKNALLILLQDYSKFRASKSKVCIKFLILKLFSVSSDTAGWLRQMHQSLFDVIDCASQDGLHLHKQLCKLIHRQIDCTALDDVTFALLLIYTIRITCQLKALSHKFQRMCAALVSKLKPKMGDVTVSALVDALIRDFRLSGQEQQHNLLQICSVIEDLLWKRHNSLYEGTLGRVCEYLDMLIEPWQKGKEIDTNLFEILPDPKVGRVHSFNMFLRMIDSLIQQIIESSSSNQLVVKRYYLNDHKHLCWNFALKTVEFTQSTITERIDDFLVRVIYQSEDLYIAQMVRNILESNVSIQEMVQNIVLKLIDSVFMDEMDLERPNWFMHWYMCKVIQNVLQHAPFHGYSLPEETLLRISQYFIKLIQLCKRQETVQKAVFALQLIWLPPSGRNHQNEDECFLMKLVDSSMAELSEPDWTKQRNMCWIIENVLRFRQNVFGLNRTNVLQVFDYLMVLLGTCPDRETTLWAILAMERLLMYSNNAEHVDEDRMGQLFASLLKLSKSINKTSKLLTSRVLHHKSQFLQFEIGLTAKWCIDNVLCALGKEDNRFDDEYFRVKLSPDKLCARNDTYGNYSLRSTFGVTSGVYYYEAIILTSTTTSQLKGQFGWCTVESMLRGREPTDANTLGSEVKYEIGVKKFKAIYHSNMEWKVQNGDCTVVGCLIDAD